MNVDQKRENTRTLASILGLAEEEAEQRLDARVQISWAPGDTAAEQLGNFVAAQLQRTFAAVGNPAAPVGGAIVELVINHAVPRCAGAVSIYCTIDQQGLYCGLQHEVGAAPSEVPPILCLLGACFVAAQVAHYGLKLPVGRVARSGVRLNFNEWPGVALDTWRNETELGQMDFAGGGAVGNAILYAMQYLPVRGNGSIIDPKPVTRGILNRCLCFEESDVGRLKVEALVNFTKHALPELRLTPLAMTVQQARDAVGGEFSCLVVGVDSRRARRNLQLEVPREVFDASTTGAEEVVFHHNLQFSGNACMGCIYPETQSERDFARHLAESLNVSVEEVAQTYIDEKAAHKICERYPDLSSQDLVGTAYDTLFRTLCASEKLKTAEQKQVLAPFAFVSQLAGCVLAIEMFLRRQYPERAWRFNYWRVSPWRGMFIDLQQLRAPLNDCEVCSQDDYKQLAGNIWADA